MKKSYSTARVIIFATAGETARYTRTLMVSSSVRLPLPSPFAEMGSASTFVAFFAPPRAPPPQAPEPNHHPPHDNPAGPLLPLFFLTTFSLPHSSPGPWPQV